jgi:hypothetical protein
LVTLSLGSFPVTRAFAFLQVNCENLRITVSRRNDLIKTLSVASSRFWLLLHYLFFLILRRILLAELRKSVVRVASWGLVDVLRVLANLVVLKLLAWIRNVTNAAQENLAHWRFLCSRRARANVIVTALSVP